MATLKYFRCHNPACAKRDQGKFSSEQPVCPQCGISAADEKLGRVIQRMALVHFDPPTGIPAIGENLRACDRAKIIQVQEMPNGDEERIEAFLRGHGVTVVELDGCMNGRWARESIVRSSLEELRALDEGRIESPRWLTMSAYADSGGIHRLGCELREADGVTARCLRSGTTKPTA